MESTPKNTTRLNEVNAKLEAWYRHRVPSLIAIISLNQKLPAFASTLAFDMRPALTIMQGFQGSLTNSFNSESSAGSLLRRRRRSRTTDSVPWKQVRFYTRYRHGIKPPHLTWITPRITTHHMGHKISTSCCSCSRSTW